MPDPLAIVILVASGESPDMMKAASAAVRRTLGAATRVEVRESADVPNDRDALSNEEQLRADAVIELTWTDSERRTAALRAHDAKTQRWSTRWIGFASVDPGSDAEVGRTVGFAAASMLPELPGDVDGSRAASTQARDPSTATAEHPATAQEPRSASAPTFQPRFAIDLLALGATDINGAASGVGPGAALHVFVAPPLSFRAGVGARWGDVSGAQARAVTVAISAGAVVHALPATRSRRFGASARLDYLLAYESLTRSSPDALGQVSKARWLSGFDTFVDGSWLLTGNFEVVAGLGLECLLGATRIDFQGPVQTATVATLAPLHAAAELGFRWGL
jgi:hypothetical protein